MDFFQQFIAPFLSSDQKSQIQNNFPSSVPVLHTLLQNHNTSSSNTNIPKSSFFHYIKRWFIKEDNIQNQSNKFQKHLSFLIDLLKFDQEPNDDHFEKSIHHLNDDIDFTFVLTIDVIQIYISNSKGLSENNMRHMYGSFAKYLSVSQNKTELLSNIFTTIDQNLSLFTPFLHSLFKIDDLKLIFNYKNLVFAVSSQTDPTLDEIKNFILTNYPPWYKPFTETDFTSIQLDLFKDTVILDSFFKYFDELNNESSSYADTDLIIDFVILLFFSDLLLFSDFVRLKRHHIQTVIENLCVTPRINHPNTQRLNKSLHHLLFILVSEPISLETQPRFFQNLLRLHEDYGVLMKTEHISALFKNQTDDFLKLCEPFFEHDNVDPLLEFHHFLKKQQLAIKYHYDFNKHHNYITLLHSFLDTSTLLLLEKATILWANTDYLLTIFRNQSDYKNSCLVLIHQHTGYRIWTFSIDTQSISYFERATQSFYCLVKDNQLVCVTIPNGVITKYSLSPTKGSSLEQIKKMIVFNDNLILQTLDNTTTISKWKLDMPPLSLKDASSIHLVDSQLFCFSYSVSKSKQKFPTKPQICVNLDSFPYQLNAFEFPSSFNLNVIQSIHSLQKGQLCLLSDNVCFVFKPPERHLRKTHCSLVNQYTFSAICSTSIDGLVLLNLDQEILILGGISDTLIRITRTEYLYKVLPSPINPCSAFVVIKDSLNETHIQAKLVNFNTAQQNLFPHKQIGFDFDQLICSLDFNESTSFDWQKVKFVLNIND